MDALYNLLKVSPLSTIRVKDICEECGLSKRSFYYHYPDKYALAADVYQMITDEALGEYGMHGEYLSSIASGAPEFNQVSKESVDFMRKEMETMVSRHLAVGKHMLNDDDEAFNSVLRQKHRALSEGKKKIMKARAAEKGLALSDDILNLGAETLLVLYDYITYRKWRNLKEMPTEEAELLVTLTNDLIDFWVDHGAER